MALNKPAVYVRVVWPRKTDIGTSMVGATTAVGRAIENVEAAQQIKREPEPPYHTSHAGYWFTLDITNEIEPADVPVQPTQVAG